MSEQSADGKERPSHGYDIDKRFAHIRVEVLGKQFTDVVRVCEKFPHLPDGIKIYVEHIDAIDLKGEDEQSPTIGELERRIADLEARVEELEAQEDLLDGEEDVKITGNRAEDFDPQKHYLRPEPVPYEDNTPYVQGDDDDRTMEVFGPHGEYEAARLGYMCGAIEAYAGVDGGYWITSPNVREGDSNGLFVSTPDRLREIADNIEEAER